MSKFFLSALTRAESARQRARCLHSPRGSMHSQRVRHMAVACSSSGSSTGLSKQSGALITKDGSRQEIADIPRFAAPPGDAHRARFSLLAFSTDRRQHRQSIIRHWRNRSLRRFQLQPLRHLGTEADFEVTSVDQYAVQNAGGLARHSHDMLDRLASQWPQARNANHFLTRSRRLAAASQSASRTLTSPCLVIRPS